MFPYLSKRDCRRTNASNYKNIIEFYLEDSPSLKKYLCDEWVKKFYRNASLDARRETDLDFSFDFPYTITEILERIIELVPLRGSQKPLTGNSKFKNKLISPNKNTRN